MLVKHRKSKTTSTKREVTMLFALSFIEASVGLLFGLALALLVYPVRSY